MADRASGCRNSTRESLHGDQARRLGGNQVGQVQPEHRRGAGQHRHLAAVDGGGEGEGVAGALRKRPQALQVHAGDAGPGGERRVRWQVGQALAFGAQLQQRERVPAGLTVETVGQFLAERLIPLVPEQLGRRPRVQALEPQGRQVGAVEQRRLALAHGQDDRDRIGDQAAEREQQGIRARPVEPVRVVDQHGDRGFLRIGGQQAEGGRAHGEAARRAGRPERQRALQCLGLRVGDLVDPGQRRAQQLEQAGERDVSLGLHPAGPEHVHAGRLLLGVGEQRRLADPGLPHDGEHAAAARAGIVEQPDERLLLVITAEQHVSESYGAHPVRSHARRGSGLGALPEAMPAWPRPTFPVRNPDSPGGHR